MPILLSYLEAKLLHQPYFEGDFKICRNVKSGSEGCFATDGECFVITKEGLINAGKITKLFQFNKSDIVSIENSKFFTKIELKNNIAGIFSTQRPDDFFNRIFYRLTRQKPQFKVVIERPLLGSFEHTPKNHKEDFDEFINAIKI